MTNVVLRCTPTEWTDVARHLPRGCTDSVVYFDGGTTNDLTGEMVPLGRVHVALLDASPFVLQVLSDMGWIRNAVGK